MLRRTFGTALVLSLIFGAIGAAPAAAFYPDYATGITGTLSTTKEVVCRYNEARRLRYFTVYPPTIGGISEEPRYVAWRYQIRVATEFQAGPLVKKSRWYRDIATVGSPTQNLKRHTVTIPADSTIPDTTAWYAIVIVVWYEAGSTTEVAGRQVITYGKYKLRRGTESRGSNACAFDYDYTWGAS